MRCGPRCQTCAITALLARRMAPLASSEITPVGMFSRTVSISWRRRSSSWTACCRVPCELIDLRAVVSQLRRHGVEGADKNTEFVLSLLGDLIIKISGGNFASAFGKRLNRNSDLFRKEESDPHNGRKQ